MNLQDTQRNVRFFNNLETAGRYCLSLVALIAITELCGWLMPMFGSHLPAGWDLLKVNTAIGMLLAVAGLWLSEPGSSPKRISASRWLAAALTVLALLILFEHLTGMRLRMDTLLAADSSSPKPGLTSAQTAMGLLLLGLAIPSLVSRRNAVSIAAEVLTFALIGFVLTLLSGYVYGATKLLGESSLIRVSPQTLICFVLLMFVVIARRVRHGVFSALFRESRAGRITLISAPLVIGLIYASGFFYIHVRQSGLLSQSDGVAISVSALSVIVLYLIMRMALRITRLENEVRGLLLKNSEQRLEETRQRYVDLVEQAIVGVVLRRASGEILLVNEAYCHLTGYARAELLGMNIQELVRTTDPGVLERINKLKPGESVWTQTRLRRRDGGEVHIEANTHRLKNGNLQSMVQDISQRKQAEMAREASERRYAELVDQALEGITVRKPGGEYLFVNDTFCRMLGYTRAEILRMNIRDIVHPEDAETIAQVQQLNSGGSVHLEKRMRRKDGHVVHVEVSARRLQDGNFQSTVQDVSERKRGEERFRSMVEGAPNAMVMAGEDGAITMVNPQAEKLFGYARAEMLGKSIETLVPERFRANHPRLRTEYNRNPQMRSMGAGRDLHGLRKDGTEVPVEIGLNPITTREGRFVLASIIDITERRQAEQREREHLEEIRLMSQRLLEAQETERRTIARELHDEIGQALTAARMNLRELERQAGDGPLAQTAADASAVVATLLQQVRQLSLDLHPTVLDDLGLAAALRWLIRTRAGGGAINVTADLTEDLPRFDSVIEHTAFRVFQEALSNVLRHSGAAGLEVKLTLDGDWLLLDIRDDGKGFDLAAARKRALAGGSLGVIGMQERARLANGHMVIESSPGQGTLVHLSLPAAER